MSLPVRHLPVLQNWDCHVCGTCCKEHLVTVSDEERRQIEAQGWDQDAEIGDLPLFRKSELKVASKFISPPKAVLAQINSGSSRGASC